MQSRTADISAGAERPPSTRSRPGRTAGRGRDRPVDQRTRTAQTGKRRRPGGGWRNMAQALLDSPVTRQVPRTLREKLERALLLRTLEGRSLEDIAQEFELDARSVDLPMLQRHAAILDEIIRPVAAAQIAAGVLGCLPPSFRARMRTGSQVLLLSKVAKVLWETNEQELEVGELLKLGTVLKAAAHSRRPNRQRADDARKKAPPPEDAAVFDHQGMSQAVRALYGLPWPAPEQRR